MEQRAEAFADLLRAFARDRDLKPPPKKAWPASAWRSWATREAKKLAQSLAATSGR